MTTYLQPLLKLLSTVTLSASLIAPLTQTAFATSFLRTGLNYPTTLEDERIICKGDNGVQSLSDADCKAVARDFYREIYYQIGNFNPAGAFDVIRPTSAEMFPDGSGFTKGLFEAIPSYIQLTGGSPYTLSIENAFAYQPIDRDTVVFLGAPLFTNFNGVSLDQKAYIENVQMSVYKRIKGTLNDPSCRSATNLTGDTCWGIMTELWTYKVPLGSGVSSTNTVVSPPDQPHPFLRATNFPLILEDQRIVCDSQIGDATTTDTDWINNCKAVAQQFYDQFYFDLKNFTGAGTFDIPASINVALDGSGYVNGTQSASLYNQVTNGHNKTISVENAFSYKPIDTNTVLVLGAPLLTIAKDDSSDISFVHNAQLSVYRRTNQGLQAPWTCRSVSHPHGNTCWVLVDKLWTYQRPLGSGVIYGP